MLYFCHIPRCKILWVAPWWNTSSHNRLLECLLAILGDQISEAKCLPKIFFPISFSYTLLSATQHTHILDAIVQLDLVGWVQLRHSYNRLYIYMRQIHLVVDTPVPYKTILWLFNRSVSILYFSIKKSPVLKELYIPNTYLLVLKHKNLTLGFLWKILI